jgi:hypothetical protein
VEDGIDSKCSPSDASDAHGKGAAAAADGGKNDSAEMTSNISSGAAAGKLKRARSKRTLGRKWAVMQQAAGRVEKSIQDSQAAVKREMYLESLLAALCSMVPKCVALADEECETQVALGDSCNVEVFALGNSLCPTDALTRRV